MIKNNKMDKLIFESVTKPGDIILVAQKKGDRFSKNTITIGVYINIDKGYVNMSNIISFDGAFDTTTSKFLDEICYVKVIMKKEDVTWHCFMINYIS